MQCVTRSLDLPVEPARAWPAIADPTVLGDWYGAVIEGGPARAGERWEFAFPDGVRHPAVLEEVEEGRSVAFRWLPLRTEADGSRSMVTPGRVVLTIEATSGGARILVEESRASDAMMRGA